MDLVLLIPRVVLSSSAVVERQYKTLYRQSWVVKVGNPTTVAAGPEIIQSSRRWLSEVPLHCCDGADGSVCPCVFALIPLLGCVCRRGCGMAGDKETCPSFLSRLEGRVTYLVGGTGI